MPTELRSTPPQGIVPDLEHPTDVLRTVNTVTYSLVLALTTLVVLGRLYVRIWITQILYVEDWFCIASWFFITGFCINGLYSGLVGGGYHAWEISPGARMSFEKTEYAASIIYNPAMWCIKATLLLILIRIFVPFRKIIYSVWAFIILMFFYYATVTGLKIVICNPIASIWDPSIPQKCLNRELLFVIDTSISVLTDLVILVLPIPLVWSLRVTLKKKLRMMALLGAGGVATGTSVVRLVLVLHLKASPSQLADQTVSIVRLNLLVVAELGIGLVCACLPAFNIFFSRYTAERASRSRYRDTSVKMSRIMRSTAVTDVESNPMSSYVEIGTTKDPRAMISPLDRVFISSSRRDETVRHGLEEL